MDARITVRFDGGSRGNPGPAGIGVVLETDDSTPVLTLGRSIGHATNNVAEYRALILGLEKAREFGAKKLRVLGDSELVIKQLRGEYKVRNETLRPLWERARELLEDFATPTIEHNRRSHNSLADALANLAMDKRRDVTDADLPADGADYSAAGSDSSNTVAPPPTAPAAWECPRCGMRITIQRPGHPVPRSGPFTCACGTRMRSD
jgi:ribonuclease HI